MLLLVITLLYRRILLERVQQSLADPSLPADGLLARFRDEYGIDSDVAKDSTITLLFAGAGAACAGQGCVVIHILVCMREQSVESPVKSLVGFVHQTYAART